MVSDATCPAAQIWIPQGGMGDRATLDSLTAGCHRNPNPLFDAPCHVVCLGEMAMAHHARLDPASRRNPL